MKFLLKIILIAGITFLLQLYLPWWSIVIAPFVVNLIIKSKGSGAFFSGFLGVFLLWLALCFITATQSEGILIDAMAKILPLNGSVAGLFIAVAFIGAFVSGLSAYAGNALRNIFISNQASKKKKGYYNPYS